MMVEPFRSRSNTWPRERPELIGDVPVEVQEVVEYPPNRTRRPPLGRSKNSAFGNVSYAELITRAIFSSEDRRLTLSQIYDWFVDNVECFKDKRSDNSSAGWKNSIRHNLSVHRCFKKIPNATTSKSCWWTVDPNETITKLKRRKSADSPKHTKILKEQHHFPQEAASYQTSLEVPDRSFRPRSQSEASIYRLPSSSPWDSVENFTKAFSSSDLDKYEAVKLIDSLVEAMKLQGADNMYLEGVEQISNSPKHLHESSMDFSLSDARISVNPEYTETTFTFGDVQNKTDMAIPQMDRLPLRKNSFIPFPANSNLSMQNTSNSSYDERQLSRCNTGTPTPHQRFSLPEIGFNNYPNCNMDPKKSASMALPFNEGPLQSFDLPCSETNTQHRQQPLLTQENNGVINRSRSFDSLSYWATSTQTCSQTVSSSEGTTMDTNSFTTFDWDLDFLTQDCYQESSNMEDFNPNNMFMEQEVR